MIAQMERVEVVFMRSELSAMIAFLQDQGVVHIESVPLALDNHPGYLRRVHLPEDEQAELDGLDTLANLLAEALPLLKTAPAHGDIAAAGTELTQGSGTSPIQWRRDIQTWHRELRSVSRRKLNIQDNIEVLRNYAAMLRVLAPILAERGVQLGETARAMVLDGYGPGDHRPASSI
jgi:hypothetical protein